MGEEVKEEVSEEERSGLSERERHDQELARVNRERQLRQGVISEESEESEAE